MQYSNNLGEGKLLTADAEYDVGHFRWALSLGTFVGHFSRALLSPSKCKVSDHAKKLSTGIDINKESQPESLILIQVGGPH